MEINKTAAAVIRQPYKPEINRMGNAPMFPSHHNLNADQNADGPIGSGIAVLVGLGAAYLVGKKRREE